jgi:hypothetical protein
MKSILLLPSKESSLKEMLFFSRAFEETGRYRCSFAVKRDYHPRWLQAIKDQGHPIHYVRSEAGGEQAAEPAMNVDARQRSKARLKQLRRKILAGPKKVASAASRAILLESVLKYRRYLSHFRQDIRDTRELCDAALPDLLVVAADRTLGLQTALLAECRRRGASSMVIPWATWSQNEDYYGRIARPNWEINYGLGRRANAFVARRFPELVIRGHEHELLFRPGEMILAAHRLGILPPHPLRCAAGSGFSDFVAVESERIHRQYLERGVPVEMMSVTGRVSSDELYRTIQAAKSRAGELKAALGATPGQKVILCAVPNSAEQNLCSWSEHWRLTDFLIGAMASFRQARVVLNVHPKSDPAHYRAIAEKHGALVAEQPIEQLMPLCDLFVSTNSSTIVMAVGCEKPVLDLEIYGVVDDCFESCPGVTIVRDEALVLPALTRLMEDQEHVQSLVREQRAKKDEWIRLDGRCGERMIEAVDRLLGSGVRSKRAA